jgi:C4-type Zn-finger protein
MEKLKLVIKFGKKILHTNKADHAKAECPICNREINPYWEPKYGGLRATCPVCEANWAES